MSHDNAAWHGTVGGYTNHACRCVLCRAAIAAKQRAYYEANKDDIAAKQRAYRERRKALDAKETHTTCDTCGIKFERTQRVRGTNTRIDCHEGWAP